MMNAVFQVICNPDDWWLLSAHDIYETVDGCAAECVKISRLIMFSTGKHQIYA